MLGVRVDTLAFLRPPLAIARANSVQPDELELRHVQCRAPVRQPANTIGEVQPAMRCSPVAHPVHPAVDRRPSAERLRQGRW